MTIQRTWWAHALFVVSALGAVACGGSTTNKPPETTPVADDPVASERFSPMELEFMEPIPAVEGLYQLRWQGPWTYTASGRTFPVAAYNLSRRMMMAMDSPTLDVMVQYGREGCRVTIYNYLPSDGLRPSDMVLLAEAERALNEMQVAHTIVDPIAPELHDIDGVSLSMAGGVSVAEGVSQREAAMVIGDERWLYKLRISSTFEPAAAEACFGDAMVLLFAHAEAFEDDAAE